MDTLQNLKNLSPSYAGFGHFGVVSGKKNFRDLLLEHESFMKEFRAAIIKFYGEKPETRYVFEQIMSINTSYNHWAIKLNQRVVPLCLIEEPPKADQVVAFGVPDVDDSLVTHACDFRNDRLQLRLVSAH